MSVEGRIESMFQELSVSEKKVAEYVQKYPEQVSKMTASQIAEVSKASAPTVVRFSKKIGYKSLMDLKIAISTEKQNDTADEFADIHLQEPFHAIRSKISNNAKIAIQETSELFSEKMAEKAVKELESAEVIYVYGIGASALVAEDIAQKWSRIGKSTVFNKDINILLPQLISQEKPAVLWLISNSGKSPEIIALAETAGQYGMKTMALTQIGKNNLLKIADTVIQTSRPKETLNRSAATNSLLTQFIAVDILFYFYLSRNGASLQKIQKTREAIKHYHKNLL